MVPSSCMSSLWDWATLGFAPSPPSTGERGERAQRFSDERTSWFSSAQGKTVGASVEMELLGVLYCCKV